MSPGTWGERRRVVQCIIFNRLSVWVGVCMTWNKLPTAKKKKKKKILNALLETEGQIYFQTQNYFY